MIRPTYINTKDCAKIAELVNTIRQYDSILKSPVGCNKDYVLSLRDKAIDKLSAEYGIELE